MNKRLDHHFTNYRVLQIQFNDICLTGFNLVPQTCLTQRRHDFGTAKVVVSNSYCISSTYDVSVYCVFMFSKTPVVSTLLLYVCFSLYAG